MRRVLKSILLIFTLMVVLVVGFIGYKVFYEPGKVTSQNDVLQPDEKGEGLKDRVSVLLIGADQRPEEEKFNTDSLILASVDPDTERTSLLSIPRDTRVELKGHGYVKINEIVLLEDLATLQSTVEELTGEEIAGYVQTNFQGFKKIIDTLGGITVNVEKDMFYETGDKEDGVINLKKGEQKLNGSEALQYARFRHDALADISRTARQQVVLKAVAKEMFKLSTIPKLPFLVPQVMDAVNTNLSSKDIFMLAKVAVGFDSSKVVSQTLPGSFLDLEGISYWKVDPIEAKKVVRNLLQGVTTDKVIDQETIDLLEPITPPRKISPSKPEFKEPEFNEPDPSETLPQVPGNSQDPNGQESPGHE